MADALPRPEVSIVSPLRYPGAKRRLSSYIAEILRLNGLKPRLLVEPFAGGASVSLELLSRGLVESVALGERDPLVSSFWRTVFRDPDWLIEQIQTVEVSLAMWDYYRHGTFSTDRERAMACLFLNRTSFSGILCHGAGPLGGRSQTSEHKIGCRFPVQTLVRRIRQAATLQDRIRFVSYSDWKKTLKKAQKFGYADKDVCFYFDPPFYEKANRLYRFSFTDRSHLELHDVLSTLRNPWILSYDPAPFILGLYSANGTTPQHVHLLYSASRGSALVASREVIITNLIDLPRETRLWRTNDEWQKRATRINGETVHLNGKPTSLQANPKRITAPRLEVGK